MSATRETTFSSPIFVCVAATFLSSPALLESVSDTLAPKDVSQLAVAWPMLEAASVIAMACPVRSGILAKHSMVVLAKTPVTALGRRWSCGGWADVLRLGTSNPLLFAAVRPKQVGLPPRARQALWRHGSIHARHDGSNLAVVPLSPVMSIPPENSRRNALARFLVKLRSLRHSVWVHSVVAK
jgi:hypothetical protein